MMMMMMPVVVMWWWSLPLPSMTSCPVAAVSRQSVHLRRLAGLLASARLFGLSVQRRIGRQTDEQTDERTDRQTDRQTERQVSRQTFYQKLDIHTILILLPIAKAIIASKLC